MTHRHRQIAVLAVIALVIAACGGGDNASDGGATTTTAASGGTTATTAGDGGSDGGDGGDDGGDSCSAVELTYWNGFSGPDGAFMKQMVDQYNAENTRGDTVKVTTHPFAQYYDKVSAALTSDSLPDVLIIHLDQLATWAARGALQPLDGVVSQLGLSGDDFPAALWEGRTYKDARYGIPLDIHPMTFYYNTELLEAAGITEVPTDAASFEAAAAAMTAGDVKGYIQPIAWPSGPMAEMLLYQFGGRVVDDAGEKALFNSDAGRQALEYLLELKNAEFSNPDVAPDAQANDFKAGTNAMTIDGIWMILGFRDAGVPFDAGSVPQFGTEMATWAGSHQLTMGAHKKGEDPCKVEASGAFIGWLTENAHIWAQGGQVPARLSARNSAAFQEVLPQANIAPSVDTAVFPPPVPGISDAYGQYGDAVNQVLSGNKDIATALADAETKANELLAQNQEKYK